MMENIRDYLKRAEELDIEPNFFMSESYLKLSKVKCVREKGWIYIRDARWCLFLPLPITGVKQGDIPNLPIWATYKTDLLSGGHYSFLDWQYIFNPCDFTNMYGKEWEVFRKNSRKWPKRNEGWTYTDDSPSGVEAGMLIAEWLEKKGSSVLDGELLARFAYFEDDPNIFKKFLYNKEGKLVAINAWDENWKYINYRICIVDTDEPFLDEFTRYLFYTDVRSKNKFVNDGGVLDNEGLERFKDKMNPVVKSEIYSWTK